jgi:hypothetical protein
MRLGYYDYTMRCVMSQEPAEGADASRLCRCGRALRRKKQRNCRLCHAEANRRYRASLKRQKDAFRRIETTRDDGQV